MAGYSRDEGVTSIQTEGEERQRTSELMQFEALGMIRIEKFKTSDFKENKMAYVPSAHISRRVDEAGTEENRAAQGQGRQRMNAWNTAWTALQDDGTVTEDSRNVNEGLGQTHRGKLQADDSVRDYTGEEINCRGGRRGGRGSHHGGRGNVGRGGGLAGRGQGGGRQAATERPIPFKRTRVVKGSGLSHVSSGQSSMKLRMASEIRPATPVSPRRSTFTLKQVSGGRPVVSTSSLRQASKRSSEVSDSKPSEKAISFEGNLATPNDFMASIFRKNGPPATTPDVSKPEVEDAAPKAVATPNGSDVAKPPVRIPAPEAIAIANDSSITKPQVGNVLAKDVAIANGSHTSKPQLGDVISKAVVSDPDNTAPAALPSAQTDLLDLDIGGEGPHQSVIDFTHSPVSKAEIGTASLKPSASPPSLTQQSPTPESSLLLKNIKTVQAWVGLSDKQLEILHDLEVQEQGRASRRPPEASVSSEDSITAVDEPESQPVEVDAAPPVSQPVIRPLTKANPQGSIAKKLVAQRDFIIGEHVHRTRFHHSALVEEFQKIRLTNKTASKLAETKIDGLPTTNPFGPAKTAVSQKSGTGPRLPAHLAHLSPVADPGAAVRAQYGPSAAPSAAPSRDRGATNARTGPSLPAHLASLAPVTDAGAAARAQYNATAVTSRGRGILNPVSNGQLRSFSSPDPATSPHSSAPPPRASMLDKTGSIGLAENHAQAPKGDDPRLMARKRGM